MVPLASLSSPVPIFHYNIITIAVDMSCRNMKCGRGVVVVQAVEQVFEGRNPSHTPTSEVFLLRRQRGQNGNFRQVLVAGEKSPNRPRPELPHRLNLN
ncbi:unnamed protein product [Nippostrongylus brasiliensis]|uniref:Secreted protein n=1 Tax=Nippostrongylus brasiliensis TaxID=27835 RepID=A0A0N4XZA4_NIPBR|nr:unnamed protein product [Nippostrongylus brasiliensis]